MVWLEFGVSMKSVRQSYNGGPKSLLMYSDDIMGLGHFRRNSIIATQFVRDNPGSSVLMLTGLPNGCCFELPEEIEVVKLPSVSKVATGHYEPRAHYVDDGIAKRIRRRMIRDIAEIYAPDIFLVDHMPVGVWKELTPTLEMLKARECPPKIVLGLRDILDAPEVTRRIWRENGVYQAIEDFYDEIFIYGCRDVVDTAHWYGLNDIAATNVEYVGYLCPDETCDDPKQFRHDLAINGERLIVVSGGGGADAYPMMKTCIEAARRLSDQPDLLFICVTGPLMPAEQREVLRSRAKGLRVRVEQCVERTCNYVYAADLVVTMAGYNSTMEAIRLAKRTLIIPREGPSAEQRIRSNVLASMNLASFIEHDELSPSIVARRILDCLDGDPVPEKRIGMNGLPNVMTRLDRLLEPELANRVAAGSLGDN